MANIRLISVMNTPSKAPAGLAWDGRSVWLNDYVGGELFRIDPKSGSIERKLVCPGVISGLTHDGERLWQSRLDEDWLQVINPQTLDFDRTLPLHETGRLTDLTWDGKHLWVISQKKGKLLTVDPVSEQITKTFTIPEATTGITFKEEFLWISYARDMRYNARTDSFEWDNEESSYYIARVDPQNGQLQSEYPIIFLPVGITWVENELWLSSASTGTVNICGFE